MEWEHHKPGYHVIEPTRAAALRPSNWINYLLGDDYEEVGFVFLNRKSAGHGFQLHSSTEGSTTLWILLATYSNSGKKRA